MRPRRHRALLRGPSTSPLGGMLVSHAPFGLWGTRVFLFLVVCGFFGVPIYDFIHPQLALADRGVETMGRIVALEPQNHSQIKYEYRVGGTAYSGEWGPWKLDTAHVGDNITVTYLPEQPRTSAAGRPNTRGWWVLPFIVLPGMAVLAATFGVRARK